MRFIYISRALQERETERELCVCSLGHLLLTEPFVHSVHLRLVSLEQLRPAQLEGGRERIVLNVESLGGEVRRGEVRRGSG